MPSAPRGLGWGFSLVVPGHSPRRRPHTCSALTWSKNHELPTSPAGVCPPPTLSGICLRPQPLASGQPCPCSAHVHNSPALMSLVTTSQNTL